MRYTKAAPGAKVVVGTRIYWALYGGRYGIVYAIHPGTTPVGGLGPAVVYGGGHFDIAFDDHLAKGTPECVVRSVQWTVFEEVATADEIVETISKANAAKLAAEAKAKADGERRAAERAKHLAENPHLTPASAKPDWSPGRLAATNIRKELKAAFPKVKFSVTSDYDSVRVEWTDGPTEKMVEAVTGKYDGYTWDEWNDDIRKVDHDATFAAVFGGCKYVSENRHSTLEAVRHAWSTVKDNPDRPGHCGWGDAGEVPETWWDHPKAREFRLAWSVTNFYGVALPVAAA